MNNFIATIIVGLITIVFGWWIQNKTPELRYQLSSPINLENVDPGTSKVAQQIDVINRGNLTANKIKIKLAKRAEKINIKKDSQEDEVNQHDTPFGGNEVDYASLQPSGQFTLTIISSYPLNDSEVEVRDDSGKATSALDAEEWGLKWANSFLFIMIFFNALALIKSFRREGLFIKARHFPYEIIKMRRPHFLSDEVWKEVIGKAVDHIVSPRANLQTSSWPIYKVLNSDKPDGISEGDWEKLLPDFQKALHFGLLTQATLEHKLDSIKTISEGLKVPRPKSFKESDWKDLQQKLVRIYYVALLTDALRWSFDSQKIIKAIHAVRSTECDESVRENYLQNFLQIYKAALVEEAFSSDDPAKFSASIDGSLLRDEDLNAIKAFAYFKQVRQILSINSVRDATLFLESPKPEYLSDADYILLSDLAETIVQVTAQKRDVQLKDAALAKETAETKELKAKILNQLKFINDFIENPNAIDKVEEYENIFAAGNMENLHKMAALLKSNNH